MKVLQKGQQPWLNKTMIFSLNLSIVKISKSVANNSITIFAQKYISERLVLQYTIMNEVDVVLDRKLFLRLVRRLGTYKQFFGEHYL